MRKLIMWNVITLDGYFEGTQPWDLPFHLTIWGDELEKRSIEQLESADYLVFGRVTYEGMADHWIKSTGIIADLMNAIPKIVISRTLTSADWHNTTLINGDPVAEIERLKSDHGKDIYVFGSADLSTTLINHHLFDEYRIGIAPIILGKGRPLFSHGVAPEGLMLTDVQQLVNGGVVLTYTK